MTRRDKWLRPPRPAVAKYRAFCEECRLKHVAVPTNGASVTFVIAMPDSWSAKKRAAYLLQPHQQKPDLDNLLKAILDATYEDDSCVYSFSGLHKIWGALGQIIVETQS